MAVLSVATHFCTPEIVPVFRKTSAAQLSCSVLPVMRPPIESPHQDTPEVVVWAVLSWIVKSACGELPT